MYEYNKVNAIASLKAISCGHTGENVFNGFIKTMQFVEKQHNITKDTDPFKMHSEKDGIAMYVDIV